MTDCLNKIVTLGVCPDDGIPTSGLTLLRAPGISLRNLEQIANETYVKGTTLAMEKKEVAITLLRNDFLGALQRNNVMAQVAVENIMSGTFHTTALTAASDLARGITLHRAERRGHLLQTYIKEIQFYPLQSGTATISITNGTTVTSWPVSLVGGQINAFTKDQLQGLPYVLPQNADARVTVTAPGISFGTSNLTCLKGCTGGLPNACGWVDGWDGTGAVKEDGFGMNILFYCACNYDLLLCDMATTFIGELLWIKWQMEIFQEQLMSNRFGGIVIYKAEQLRAETLPNLESRYSQKWADLMAGMPSILKQYRDQCLDCRGIKWVTNL